MVTLVCSPISSCLNFCSVPSREPKMRRLRVRACSSSPCARSTAARVGSSRHTADGIRARLLPGPSSSPSLSFVRADNLPMIKVNSIVVVKLITLLTLQESNYKHYAMLIPISSKYLFAYLLKTVLVSCFLLPNESSPLPESGYIFRPPNRAPPLE